MASLGPATATSDRTLGVKPRASSATSNRAFGTQQRTWCSMVKRNNVFCFIVSFDKECHLIRDWVSKQMIFTTVLNACCTDCCAQNFGALLRLDALKVRNRNETLWNFSVELLAVLIASIGQSDLPLRKLQVQTLKQSFFETDLKLRWKASA